MVRREMVTTPQILNSIYEVVEKKGDYKETISGLLEQDLPIKHRSRNLLLHPRENTRNFF